MSGGGNMERVLRLMAEKQASDVYLSSNSPILIKINGQILQLSDQPLSHTQPRQLLAELLTPQQLEELDDTGELNVGIGINSGVACVGNMGSEQRFGEQRHRVLAEIEKPLLLLSLAAARGNQIRAARLLGINRNTLRKKLGERRIDAAQMRLGPRNGRS